MPAHLADPDHQPSFTKGIFLGEIRESLAFPFPELTSDERESLVAITDAFTQWAAIAVDAARHDREGRFADDVPRGMADLGLMGLNIAEEYGGFGASTMLFSRVFGTIGETDPALAVYFGAHLSIGAKGISLFGTKEQKARWLPQCASGERVAAFCLTEAGSGSDAQAMRTTAVPSADGTHYLLNGEKLWISNAGYAGVLTVFAKTPAIEDKSKQPVTAFIVDAHASGVTLGKLEDKMGIKASDTRAISFTNVRVPSEDRLGEVGQGFKIALEILNSGRLGLAAASSRGTRRIMNEALAYAKERKQFGRAIGSFGMIQRKFATNAVDCYAADSAWMLTASMVDRGGIDFSLETAACKIFASELAFRAAADAQQIAGGIGYSKEYPYERAVRDSRINLIFEGTNEILRALIALSGMQQPGEHMKALGAALHDKLHAIGAIGSYVAGRVKRQLSMPSFSQVHPALKAEATMVARGVHALAMAVENTLLRHGKDILERQLDHERMANAAIEIYVSTAVLSRASWAIARTGSVERAASDVDCARLFVAGAMRRARRSVRALTHNQDQRLKALAERALETGDLTIPTPTDL